MQFTYQSLLKLHYIAVACVRTTTETSIDACVRKRLNNVSQTPSGAGLTIDDFPSIKTVFEVLGTVD